MGGSAERAPAAAVDGEPQGRTGQLKWAMFLAGHLISVGVVVKELAEIDVCFIERELLYDDETTAQEDADTLRNLTILSLTLGLLIDVSSAIVLSATYRYPLDVKNALNIPAWVLRNRVGSAVVRVVGPLSWSVVCASGAASSYYSIYKNDPCGVDSYSLGSIISVLYLVTSGFFMAVLCVCLLLLSFVMLPTCCSDPASEIVSFATTARPAAEIRIPRQS